MTVKQLKKCQGVHTKSMGSRCLRGQTRTLREFRVILPLLQRQIPKTCVLVLRDCHCYSGRCLRLVLRGPGVLCAVRVQFCAVRAQEFCAVRVQECSSGFGFRRGSPPNRGEGGLPRRHSNGRLKNMIKKAPKKMKNLPALAQSSASENIIQRQKERYCTESAPHLACNHGQTKAWTSSQEEMSYIQIGQSEFIAGAFVGSMAETRVGSGSFMALGGLGAVSFSLSEDL